MSEYNASVITATKETALFFEEIMQEGVSAKNAITYAAMDVNENI